MKQVRQMIQLNLLYELRRFVMTNIQAFILAFIVLTIQAVTLIVFGSKFGMQGVFATGMLFLIVDVCLCACADILKVVKEK